MTEDNGPTSFALPKSPLSKQLQVTSPEMKTRNNIPQKIDVIPSSTTNAKARNRPSPSPQQIAERIFRNHRTTTPNSNFIMVRTRSQSPAPKQFNFPHSTSNDRSNVLTGNVMTSTTAGSSASAAGLYESRDEISTLGGVETLQNAIVPPSPGSLASRGYEISDNDMDEVLMQRYLFEKNKRKTAEADSLTLSTELIELQQTMEHDLSEANSKHQAAETKLEQQMKMTNSLHDTIRNLQNQFAKQAEETGTKIMEMRSEAHRDVTKTREEAEKSINSMKEELQNVQSKLNLKESLLEEEGQKIAEIKKLVEERDVEIVSNNKSIVEKESKIKELDITIQEMKESMELMKKEHEKKTNELSQELTGLKEQLEFEGDKASDFSSELKLMSYKYVESEEGLNEMTALVGKLMKDLEANEKRLKQTLTTNVSLENQLEEIAKGLIDTDGMLENERKLNNNLTQTVQAVRYELEEELKHSLQFENEFALVKEVHERTRIDAEKWEKSSKSLSNELSAVAQKLDQEKQTSKTLAEELDITEKNLSVARMNLEDIEKSAKSVLIELRGVKQNYLATSEKLQISESKLQQKTAEFEDTMNKLEVQDAKVNELEQTLEKTKEEDDRVIFEEREKLTSILIKLSKCQEDLQSRTATLDTTQGDFEEIMATSELLAKQLEQKELELEEVSSTLKKEREEHSEKAKGDSDKMNSISTEAKTMKSQYITLFDNLVETEEKLKESEDALEAMKETLKLKTLELKNVDETLHNQMHEKDSQTQKEVENVKSMSRQLEESKKQNGELYNQLVVAEEQILAKDEEMMQKEEMMKKKEAECIKLESLLKKEKKGPQQRKLKVAKKMIHAEKQKQKSLSAEVQAKDVMLKRTLEQSEILQSNLAETKQLLQREKEKKTTHSGRAIQELHNQLDAQKESANADKENLRMEVKSEQAKIEELTLRLNALESTSGNEILSRALEEKQNTINQVKVLEEKNQILKQTVEEKSNNEAAVSARLAEMEKKFNAVSESMDTLTNYCNELEEEKKKLLQGDGDAEFSLRFQARNEHHDELLTLGPLSFSDEESRCDASILSGRSARSTRSTRSAKSTRQLPFQKEDDRFRSYEAESSASTGGAEGFEVSVMM